MDIGNFFKGGLTIRVHDERGQKAIRRKMGNLARKARLPFSGQHVVIQTHRAYRRAQGAGIVEGQIITNTLQKTLVASGVSKDETEVKWEQMW